MNNNIKQLADRALASTQWTVVNSLSTELVNRELELDIFTRLLLDDCMDLCEQLSLEQNKRFAPIIHAFVKSFKESVKEKYTG
jgi:hypothetical protein